jgi:peroxiredoxin Q/BCP
MTSFCGILLDAIGDPMALKEGSKAPEFTLENENAEPVSLKSLRGKDVVLFFYPKADTPG